MVTRKQSLRPGQTLLGFKNLEIAAGDTVSDQAAIPPLRKFPGPIDKKMENTSHVFFKHVAVS